MYKSIYKRKRKSIYKLYLHMYMEMKTNHKCQY